MSEVKRYGAICLECGALQESVNGEMSFFHCDECNEPGRFLGLPEPVVTEAVHTREVRRIRDYIYRVSVYLIRIERPDGIDLYREALSLLPPKEALAADQGETACEWSQDIDGVWHTSCGLDWQMSNDEPPPENEMAYCPKCGRRLNATPFEYQGETEEGQDESRSDS